MKTFIFSLLFLTALALGTAAARGNATTHLYTRAELESFSKEQLVDIAYSMQRRIIFDEATSGEARETSVVAGTPTPQLSMTSATRHRSVLLTMLGVVAGGFLVSDLLSHPRAAGIGNQSLPAAKTANAFRGAPEALTTTAIATSAPNPQQQICNYLGITSTMFQSYTASFLTRQDTSQTELMTANWLNELPSLGQAMLGCNFGGSTNVPQSGGAVASSLSRSGASGRPLQATLDSSTTVAPSVQSKQCAAYSNLATFLASSGPSWSNFPAQPLKTVKISDASDTTGNDDYYVRYAFVGGTADKPQVSAAGPEYHIKVPRNRKLEVPAPVPPEGSKLIGWQVYVARGVQNENNEFLQGDRREFNAPYVQDETQPLATASPWPSAAANAANIPTPASPSPNKLYSTIASFTSATFKGIHTASCASITPNISTVGSPAP